MGDMSDKMRGSAKEGMGKMTGNKTQEMQGKAIKSRGKIKQKMDDMTNRTDDSRRMEM
jgi:uncharacterized protein YjbJ (UPF0337 family)